MLVSLAVLAVVIAFTIVAAASVFLRRRSGRAGSPWMLRIFEDASGVPSWTRLFGTIVVIWMLFLVSTKTIPWGSEVVGIITAVLLLKGVSKPIEDRQTPSGPGRLPTSGR